MGWRTEPDGVCLALSAEAAYDGDGRTRTSSDLVSGVRRVRRPVAHRDRKQVRRMSIPLPSAPPTTERGSRLARAESKLWDKKPSS